MDSNLERKKSKNNLRPQEIPRIANIERCNSRQKLENPPILRRASAQNLHPDAKIIERCNSRQKLRTEESKEKQITGHKYTDVEINEILSDGYIQIHPQLWSYIPSGSHIRYIKKSSDLPRCERFRPGGFVKNQFVNGDGAHMITLENSLYGRADDHLTFPIAYKDIDELWKKYDRSAFIEIHLINCSLAQKKQQIELLTQQNIDLIRRVELLEDILRVIVNPKN